ncbi:MAG: ComF family protein [Rhodothermaceae bacterium]
MAKIIKAIFDFFLPRFCVNCNKKLSLEIDFICSDCKPLIKTVDKEFINREFEKKFLQADLISAFQSSFLFATHSPIQSLVHNLKYSQNYRSGVFLGELAAEIRKSELENWEIDLVIPVPLHRVKKAERGYNQAYYIAKGVGNILNIPVATNAIKRVKYTQSQTTFNLNERKENMTQAFEIKNTDLISGKNILLIDDVITTGATISACAEVLKEKKAKNIFAFSVAIPDETTSCQEPKLQE